MQEGKETEQKMKTFDDVLFTMTPFSTRKLRKTILLGEKKYETLKWPQKFLNYVL